MIGLSTVYLNGPACPDWPRLLKAARRLGYDSFELDVAVPSAWLPDIKKSVASGEAKILSVHNFCPKVESVPDGRSIWSAYLITSEDETERRRAVDLTKRSVETASAVGASIVVAHSGQTEVTPHGRDLAKFLRDFGAGSAMYAARRDELKKNRAAVAERYLHNAVKSLDELARFAVGSGVRLGLENRFFYHEIPLLDEFGEIFRAVGSPSLAFWYDVGHGEVFIRMGLMSSHEEILEPYRDRIAGFHLHDVRGTRDHYAPGEGEMDYTRFLGYMRSDTIKIIEAHPYSNPDAVISARDIFAVAD